MKSEAYHHPSNVIACQYCQTDKEGKLLIGEAAMVSQVLGLIACPSCRAPLLPEDIVAVGIDYVGHHPPEAGDV